MSNEADKPTAAHGHEAHSSGETGIQEPVPRHPPPPRHSWPQPQGNNYYHHPPPGRGTHDGFHIMHTSRPMMQHTHAHPPYHEGYPPHVKQPSLPPPQPAGGYYAPPPAYYAGVHPAHPGDQHAMHFQYGNYYQSYPGYPSPYPPRPPEATVYHQHSTPPPPLPYSQRHPEARMPPHGEHYPGSLSYPQTPGDTNQYPHHSSSFSVDSRSTLGLTDPVYNTSSAAPHPETAFPANTGLRSIAHDASTSPSPPPIPPIAVNAEPHPISAHNSLDETEGGVGGPLRHYSSALNKHPAFSTVSSIPQEMGSSEKRETLDTASVLLAFSSAKKRPSSTTSTIDDTDALSLATMSTLPHSVAPLDHSIPSCPPKDYPKRLTMPEDKDRLNQLHCYIRNELLEIVVIQPADPNNPKETDSFSKIPTSTDPLQIGRVGLRCVHCSMSADGGRSGPSMSIFYPKSLGEIYRLVTSWKRCHLSKCKNVPKNVRDELSRLSSVKARGKTSYWSDSAAQLGLMNMPTKIGGICFSASASCVVRSESLTPAQLTLSITASDQPQSPESVPAISDASTFVSNATKDIRDTKSED